MTSLLQTFRFFLTSLLLLTMLVPAAQADFVVISEPVSQQQAMDCHETHDVQPQHQHSSDCAQSCDCAATSCHVNAAFSQTGYPAADSLLISKLMLFAEQLASQSPAKFERPPRS